MAHNSAATADGVVDVLIIGAGLSGIGTAAHLVRECPDKDFTIVESRGAIGGTWDLFRYPGVRSDSDMYTFAYSFKPWHGPRAIGEGPEIRDYIEQTADEYGITDRIRFHHRVVSADWSSARGLWSVRVQRTDTGEALTIEARWLVGATGYYDYGQGFRPDFPGEEKFAGRIVHPQRWPEDLDYAGKNVAVIGSGATAVTLVPALAERGARHVTMVQRTPSYIAAIPQSDTLESRLRGRIPDRLADPALKWKNVLNRQFQFSISRAKPDLVRERIREGALAALPEGYAVDTHFNPPYDPWDQRLCAVPDGDLFKAISAGTASIVTDRIRTFTPTGLEMESGQHVDADIIVTATGLNVQWLGGMTLSVDGRDVEPGRHYAYKGMMVSGVPNLTTIVGYTNNSWTLKADLAARYLTATLRFMDARGYATAVPREPFGQTPTPLLDLDAGYVRRGAERMPKQGTRKPWRLHQNYLRDIGLFSTRHIDDGFLEFGRGPREQSGPQTRTQAGTAVEPTDTAAEAAAGSVRTIRMGGGRVRYRDEGIGTPVVMVHGIGRSLEDWDEQFRLLADSGHRLIAVDLPGYGDSTALSEPYSLEALGRFLGEFLDAIGIAEPAHLVGNSLGGAVVMQLAARAPHRVASLTLVDPAGFGREVAPLIRLMSLRPLAKLLMSRPSLESARKIEQTIFHDSAFVTDERVRLAHRLSARPDAHRVFADTAAALGTLRGVKEEWRSELQAALRELRIPTLIVWGADDKILPAKHLAAATGALPHAQTLTFPNAGHMPQIECAEDLADLAVEFWAQARSRVAEAAAG